MKRLKLVVALVFASLIGVTSAFSQTDSLVTFTGTLINKRTGEPLPGLSVLYKKLPYESEIGHLVTGSNGQFTAYFRAGDKYSILIENEGFLKIAEIINPMDGAVDMKVEKTFKMLEGGVGSVLKLTSLKFRLGEATILEESYGELDALAEMLKETPNLTIRLEGHTDYVGNPTANLNLSQMRVEAVKKYLVDKGVEANRIETKAFGGSQPLVRSTSSAERSKNRRVEVRIIGDNRVNN